MIARSWDGLRTRVIAEELDRHAQTVRERFHAFNERGLDGLGMKPGSGRKPRLSEAERSAVIALVASPPPGRLVTYSDGTLAPAGSEGGDVSEWSLDALAAAAQAQGIQIGRSQVRRILRPGVRALAPAHALLGAEHGQGLRPKRTAVVACYTDPPDGSTTRCLDELGPVVPRTFPPAPGPRPPAGPAAATGSRPPWTTGAARRRSGSTARCG
jgi:transposase